MYYKIEYKDNNIYNCCVDNLILTEYHKPATKEQIDFFKNNGILFIKNYCKKHYYDCYKWGGDLDNIIGEAILKAYQNLDTLNKKKNIYIYWAYKCKTAFHKEYISKKKFGISVSQDVIDYVKRENYYD